MEFELFATNVDLRDIPSYTTSIMLEGQLLKLSFLWNERIGKRTIFIRNSADVCYLQNTVLHPNESFELNSNAVFDDLPYKVVLQKVGDTNKVGNIYNWSKDFILCFYRTIDIETEKLNVKYGVTAPSTPTLPKPFGNWILNQGYELVNEDIKYTAYNTNGVSYYDSFANFDLVTALVRSFHDSDLQKYAAFTTAVEQLIGNVDWVLEPANNQVTFIEPFTETGVVDPHDQYGYTHYVFNGVLYKTVKGACMVYAPSAVNFYITGQYCQAWSKGDASLVAAVAFSKEINPIYDENTGQITKTLPYSSIAQKIISNAESSADEVLKLLSEDYINLVANSVFDSNPSKQFVKLEDLIPQLEANKVLR